MAMKIPSDGRNERRLRPADGVSASLRRVIESFGKEKCGWCLDSKCEIMRRGERSVSADPRPGTP